VLFFALGLFIRQKSGTECGARTHRAKWGNPLLTIGAQQCAQRKEEAMKQGSTLLKVVSIIMIVFAGLAIIAGILFLAGGGIAATSGATTSTLDLNGTTYTGTEAAIGSGIIVGLLGGVMLFSGIVDLVIGIVGVKASGENGKHTAALVLGIIGVICAAISLITGAANNANTILTGLVGLVLPVLYLVGVIQTRKQLEEQPAAPQQF
jgi:hypothetical protein